MAKQSDHLKLKKKFIYNQNSDGTTDAIEN